MKNEESETLEFNQFRDRPSSPCTQEVINYLEDLDKFTEVCSPSLAPNMNTQEDFIEYLERLGGFAGNGKHLVSVADYPIERYREDLEVSDSEVEYLRRSTRSKPTRESQIQYR